MRTPHVLLVSKRECPLCDEAKHALDAARAEIPFTIETKLIDEHPDLHELYKFEVPVVFVDGKKLFYGRVSPLLLKKALREAARGEGR